MKKPHPVQITPESRFSNADSVSIPINHIPLFRTQIAIQNKVERNLLFVTWGGLGDQMCAEPTLRFALDTMKDCKISLLSERPELFAHLNFHEVFDSTKVTPKLDKYFVFQTITPPDHSNLVWQFFSHMLTHCVDFPSLCALRCQLPISYKQPILTTPEWTENSEVNLMGRRHNIVVVHPGRHWQSKTFPKAWWDRVIAHLLVRGMTVVLIGADTDDNRGTVDVNATGCIDLRNRTTLMETAWLLRNTPVLLSNDSSPLHLAASGCSWVGYVATCKHPDFITHWRKPPGATQPVWGWRMENLGLGGIWDIIDYCPNKPQEVSAESVPEKALLSWLPEPKVFAEWACERSKFEM